jgi:hypothetical protein
MAQEEIHPRHKQSRKTEIAHVLQVTTLSLE